MGKVKKVSYVCIEHAVYIILKVELMSLEVINT